MQFHRNMCVCWLNKGMKNRIQIQPLWAGFKPVRGDPTEFLVHHLNHSATTTHFQSSKSAAFWNRKSLEHLG